MSVAARICLGTMFVVLLARGGEPSSDASMCFVTGMGRTRRMLGFILRAAAAAAHKIKLREPRPVGFPLLFDAHFNLIEPAGRESDFSITHRARFSAPLI